MAPLHDTAPRSVRSSLAGARCDAPSLSRRRTQKLLAVVAGFALLTACAQPVGVDVGELDSPWRQSGEPVIAPTWISCEKHEPGPDRTGEPLAVVEAYKLPLLPADFVATAAIICGQRSIPRPSGGEDLVAEERRTENVAAMVETLRLPDLPRAADACTLDLLLTPWMVLLDASGRWLRPGVPVDGCGKPRIEVREAIEALDLTVVSSRIVRAMITDESVRAGCNQGYSNMVVTETSDPTRQLGTYRVDLPSTDGVRLCVYRVPVEQQDSVKPSGDFEYGGKLPASQWLDIERALRSAGPVRACTQYASRFAMLSSANPDQPGPAVFVELDGCQRILAERLTGAPGLAQADPILIALLALVNPQ